MRGSWVWLALAVGCKKGDEGTDHTGGPTGPDYKSFPLAGDVVVDSVRINQGSERTLYVGPGVIGGGNYPPPVLAGRPGRLTVEFSALDEQVVEERDVAVVLTLTASGGGGTEMAEVGHLTQVLSVFDGRPEVEFALPGTALTPGMTVSVELHEVGSTSPGTYTDEDVWTSDPTTLDVVASERIELHIIPVQIQSSTLMPQTGQAQLDLIAARFLSMYPASGVDVIVEPQFTWNTPIGPFTGWEALLGQITQMRTAASVPSNAYFYGLFMPTATEAEFCSGGCTLGLSNLPATPADDWAKSSIGVGFLENDTMVDTMLHEVGHAHGRLHAPCGGAAGPDPAYPYANATIGVDGWDDDRESLLTATDHFDVMGYCFPIWISDYNYTALFTRINAVLARKSGAPTDWRLAVVYGDGTVTPVGPVVQGPAPSDEVMVFDALDDSGRVVDQVSGFFLPFDHAEGGVTLLPPDAPDHLRARLD